MGIGLRMWSPVDITAIYMSGDCPSNSILQMPLVFIDFYTTMHVYACMRARSFAFSPCRTLSLTFFSHLKTVLFSRAGVGSASEQFS